MLIVIEGIDGSGKSTVAPLVASVLAANGTWSAKDAVGAVDAMTAERARALRGLIWNSDESAADTFGAAHWILLIASWYAGLAKLRPELSDGSTAVLDGWYYRNIAKTLLREPLDPAWVEGLFEPAPTPDAVVLLDVAPDVAWARRSGFKDTELGRWDGFLGPPAEAFRAYQSLIRDHLLRMAEQRGWLVVRPDESESQASVARRIVELLPAACRNAINEGI